MSGRPEPSVLNVWLALEEDECQITPQMALAEMLEEGESVEDLGKSFGALYAKAVAIVDLQASQQKSSPYRKMTLGYKIVMVVAIIASVAFCGVWLMWAPERNMRTKLCLLTKGSYCLH